MADPILDEKLLKYLMLFRYACSSAVVDIALRWAASVDLALGLSHLKKLREQTPDTPGKHSWEEILAFPEPKKRWELFLDFMNSLVSQGFSITDNADKSFFIKPPADILRSNLVKLEVEQEEYDVVRKLLPLSLEEVIQTLVTAIVACIRYQDPVTIEKNGQKRRPGRWSYEQLAHDVFYLIYLHVFETSFPWHPFTEEFLAPYRV